MHVLLIAIAAVLVGTAGQLLVRFGAARRLAHRIEPAWRPVLAAQGLRRIRPRGLAHTWLAGYWTGELRGWPLRVLAHRKIPSRFLYDWFARAVVQVGVDPGPVRIRPRSRSTVLWRIGDADDGSRLLWPTVLQVRFVGWGAFGLDRTDAVPIPGVDGLLVAGLSDEPPPPVREALRRMASAESVHLGDDRLVVAWRLFGRDAEPGPALERTLEDVGTLVAWLGGDRAPSEAAR